MSQVYVVTVSRVVERIRQILKDQVHMDAVWVQGEISNLTKHRSGHCYFSLKDEKTSMSCVMFSSYVKYLKFDLQEGMKVMIQADVDLYIQRGSLQLYVKKIKQEGIGALYQELEERKKRLEQAGYFLDSHKKPKPEIIENIGIVTAKEGAALQDVLKTLHHRWPMMKVQLYPALVQGNHAPSSMIEQLQIADINNHDAILLVRGGGSFEDLFCFNDESLVHTIYDMQTYIVTGVGHEVDTTLVDYVSDHRAVTPTAAAQWVSLDQHEVRDQIQNYRNQMVLSLQRRIIQYRTQLNGYQNNPYLQEPKSWLLDKRLRLDHYQTQMDKAKEQIINQKTTIQYSKEQLVSLLQKRLETQVYELTSIKKDMGVALEKVKSNTRQHLLKNMQLLDAYSPLQTIMRGYSVTRLQSKVIQSIDQVKVDQTIDTLVKDGVIRSVVIKKEKNDE